MHNTLLACFASFLFVAGAFAGHSVADEPTRSFSLASGEYLLRITSEDVPKDQRDVTHAATVKVDALSKEKTQKLLVDMRRTDPPHVTELRGLKSGNKIKLFVAGVEHEDILTIHLVGTLAAENEAKGKMTVIADGAIAARGEWTLKKPDAASKSK